ncbi:hypothetical protein [Bradyrhizobium sp. McL0616]|uniref:hypothetical protein n=1 Tax=Bradyrhizobium sp. McL0616 TaxID=3415674 RepID=UPI003CEE3B97
MFEGRAKGGWAQGTQSTDDMALNISSQVCLETRCGFPWVLLGARLAFLAVSARNAEAVTCRGKGLLRLSVLEAKARADVRAVDMPVHFIFFGDARSFPA